jgi:arabinofuranosyltransferase
VSGDRPGDFPRGSTLRLWATFALCVLTVILFTWNTSRYAFLGDDAFISFRYARNLVDGHGLVWNPGERVEGYTNFLWVLIMALGMLVHVRPEVFSNVIGIASGVIVLLILIRLSAKRAGRLGPAALLAPLVLATSRTFTAWCTGGLATMFFTMLVLWALVEFDGERTRHAGFPIRSAAAFALAALTRPEGYIFIGVAGAAFILDLFRGRRTIQAFLAWAVPIILIAGSHLVWRHSYYGYWLPNSFYAKVSGFWGRQAYHYLSMFHWDYKVFYFAPLALVPLLVRRRFIYSLFAAAIAAYLAYVVYVGGDRFEFRLLVPVFPLFYWLTAEGIGIVASAQRGRGRASRLALPAGAALALMLWVTTYMGSRRPEAMVTRYDIASLEEIKAYAERRAWEGKCLRALIDRGLLPDDLLLCVTGAGAVPYYSGLPTLDLYGMNDVRIAHEKITERGVIAHEKRGSPAYMRERGVELFDRLNKLFAEAPVQNEICPDNRGCWKSIRVDGYFLNFVTFLPEPEYQSRFGRLLRAGPINLPAGC